MPIKSGGKGSLLFTSLPGSSKKKRKKMIDLDDLEICTYREVNSSRDAGGKIVNEDSANLQSRTPAFRLPGGGKKKGSGARRRKCIKNRTAEPPRGGTRGGRSDVKRGKKGATDPAGAFLRSPFCIGPPAITSVRGERVVRGSTH